MKTTDIMARLQAKYPLEKEYLQAVQEVQIGRAHV